MLSSILRFIQKEILANLDQRKEFMTVLNKLFKGHSKDRTNAYLALLMLILEKLLKYIPYVTEDDLMFGIETGDKDIYTAWIEEQNSTSRETETGSNTILQYLDGIIREHLHYFKGKIPVTENGQIILEHPEYGLHIVKHTAEDKTDPVSKEEYHVTLFEFIATSAEIVDAFDRLAKNTGKRNPYDSASIFTARLRNDLDLLKKNGWELESSPGNEPYYKIIRGKRFLKFKHTMVR
jgi:DNA primase